MKRFFQSLIALFTMDWAGFIEADQQEEFARTK